MTPGNHEDTTMLAVLVYELLDAHHDTAELLDVGPASDRSRAHMNYLRALQRRGREILAKTSGRHQHPA
jgi:hypothetical protein